MALRQERIDQLIRSYRARGHMIARLDPLGSTRNEPPELEPAFFGFTEADLDGNGTIDSGERALRRCQGRLS